MHRPRLLILDEPTSGLDPLNQQEFDQMVVEARRCGADGVSLVAHPVARSSRPARGWPSSAKGELVRLGGVAELKDIKRHEVTITFSRRGACGSVQVT